MPIIVWSQLFVASATLKGGTMLRTNKHPRPNFKTAAWQRSTISYKGEGDESPRQISVFLMPYTNGKVAVGYDDRAFYNYNATNEGFMLLERGVYALYRQITHMLTGHEHELPTVEKVRAIARKAHAEFSLLTKAENPEALAVALREKLFEALDLMGAVRNDNKVAAKTEFEIMIPLKDSRGRRNVGVLRCRTLRALEKLMARLAQIGVMDPFLQYRHAVVRSFIGHVEMVIREMQENLETIYKLLNTPAVKRKRGWLRTCRDLAVDARDNGMKLGVKPYWRPYRKHLKQDLTSLVNALDRVLSNDTDGTWLEEAQKAAQVSRMCLRGLRTRAKMEHARVHLSTWEKHPYLYSTDMDLKITAVFERMQAEELPAINDSLFDTPVFDDVRTRFASVVAELKKSKPDFKKVLELLDLAIGLI